MGDQEILNSADSRIAEIYNNLAGQLEQSKQATQGIYQQGVQQVGQAYQGANDAAQASGSGLMKLLGDSAARMNMRGALPGASANLQDTLGSFLGRMAQERGGRMASLSQLGTNMTAVGEGRKASAAAWGAQKRAETLKAIQLALTQQHGQEALAKGNLELQRLKGEMAIQAAEAKARATQDNRDIALARLGLSQHDSARADILAGHTLSQLPAGARQKMQELARNNEYQTIMNSLGGSGSVGSGIMSYLIAQSKDLPSALSNLSQLEQSGDAFTDPNTKFKLPLRTKAGTQMNWGALSSYLNDYFNSGQESYLQGVPNEDDLTQELRALGLVD